MGFGASPGLLVLHDGRQLLVVPHQDEALGEEQRPQTDGLADLRRFVHDAEVKAPVCENGMLDAHTGSCDHQLVQGSTFMTQHDNF